MLNIYRWSKTDEQTRKKIMERAMFDISSIREYVADWLETIKNEGDAGIVKYTRQFDNKNFHLKDLQVKREEIEKAYKVVDPNVVEMLKLLTLWRVQNTLLMQRECL